jgi:hypothetical protein
VLPEPAKTLIAHRKVLSLGDASPLTVKPREVFKVTNDHQSSSDLRPVQHPVIARTAIPETILQFFILGGSVAVLEWFGVRFELTLLVLLVLGFTLNTMNIMMATMSQNVHLTEIRDLLLKQRQE